ncbi:MAG: polyprenyl synthetase family protein [Candidatus Thalassarchaeaceae archaeon]|nr:polyprenyl synthetase family protein [Candidatus Thalassarchaeaceae archaeon]
MFTLRKVEREISRHQDRFEEALETFVQARMISSDAPAMSLAREILLGGGKRFRPIIGILAYEAAGGEDDPKIMDIAMGIELIHTATLIHDDIYDQSKTRRGKPTLHTTHGLSHAIIAGDYLFALGYSLGSRADDEVMSRIAEACVNIATGELLQFNHIGDLTTTPEDYYAIIDGKTAGPFANGCACAAIVAGASDEIRDELEKFGWEIGRAFQLVDDLLDLTGEPSMGKPRGTDVHDGKMTLPLIHGLTMLHGVERQQLADVLQNFSDDRWGELTNLLESAGSFDYARQLIHNHIDRALSSLEVLPDNNAKELLTELAKQSLRRRT